VALHEPYDGNDDVLYAASGEEIASVGFTMIAARAVPDDQG
jgi:hypothetical protein